MNETLSGELWVSSLALACTWAVIATQLAILAMAAACLTHLGKQASVNLTHRIWLVAIGLALLVGPLHVLVGGWPVSISLSTTQAAPEYSLDQIRPTLMTQVDGLDFNHNAALPAYLSINSAPKPPEQAASVPQPAKTKTWPLVVTPSWPTILNAVLVLYLAGAATLASRIEIATSRLSRLALQAEELISIDTLTQETCRQLELTTPPRIAFHPEVGMPMMFGITRPTVLLPIEFASWPPAQQRCVLLHELAHAKRRDTWWQLAGVVLKCLYWFHPASWYLDRQQTRWRELATDQLAVGAGMPRQEYATCLLNVLERLQGRRTVAAMAIGMSCSNDFAQRISHLFTEPAAHPRKKLLSIVAPTLLLAIVAVTTLQIKWLSAQPPEQAAQAATGGRLPHGTPIDQADFHLLLQACDVATPEELSLPGALKPGIASVSGRVLDQEGKPVAGAEVVLHSEMVALGLGVHLQWLGHKINSRSRLKTSTAKVATDAQGRFSFNEVPYPLTQYPLVLPGYVIVTHPTLGTAWQTVNLDLKNNFQLRDVDLRLEGVTELEGDILWPDGKPLVGATVAITSLQRMHQDPDFALQSFINLTKTQFAPRTETDHAGHFRFANMPINCEATLRISHPETADTFVSLGVYNDLQAVRRPEQKPGDHRFGPPQLWEKPYRIEVDPGIELNGTVVNEEGQPVAGASIDFDARDMQTQSSTSGEFSLRFPSYMHRVVLANDSSRLLLAKPPKGSPLLDGALMLKQEELRKPMTVTVRLRQPVKVTGKLLLPEGATLETLRPVVRFLNMSALEPPRFAHVQADGTFDIEVTKDLYRVLVGTNEAGFKLPSQTLVSLYADKQHIRDLDGPELDLTDGRPQAVEPIVIERREPLVVSVVMPDGQPAPGANVHLILAMKSDAGLSGWLNTPYDSEGTTDAQGRAVIPLRYDLKSEDVIEVKLTRDGIDYSARVQPVPNSNQITVTLRPN